MICVRCGHDSKHKDRADGRCPKCRGEFAFEPRKGDPWSDRAFQRAIDHVSAEGAVRFLPAHVYLLLNRRAKPGLLTAAGAAIGELWSAFSGLFRKARALPDPRPVTWSRGTFDVAWERWVRVHGAPAGLLTPRRGDRRPADAARRAALEVELAHYSFDRAVICDRREVVDVLLANRFHFENNAAILAVDGYPEDAFALVRTMLRNNPRLTVLALHDATPTGCRLAHRLSTDPEWFAGGPRVVDVGLRPAHARFFAGAAVATGEAGVAAGEGIAPEEAEWLGRWRLEVAAIPPAQLVKRLFRAIQHAESGGFDGGGGSDGGWVILGTDTGTTDGGGDSFG